MHKDIFINLPVKDLAKAKEFFAKMGYTFDSQFTDEKAACLELGENIFAMLLTEEFFKTFTDKKIADGTKENEVLIALSCASRERVDDLVSKAVAAGGAEYRKPEDHGWMYERSFRDLDGHAWELVYMDMSKVPGAEASAANAE